MAAVTIMRRVLAQAWPFAAALALLFWPELVP